MESEKRHVLITGATGLLGSYLLSLLAADYKVWAISQNPPANEGSVSWLSCDLAGDLHGLHASLPERIDAVVHLAQSPHFREFPEKADHVFRVNVASLHFLLQAAAQRGCRHFVNASTGGIYPSGAAPFDENNVRVADGAIGLYPASKLSGELLVNAYAGLFNVANLRFFFIYGRGQNASMLIPRLVDSVDRGLPITLQGDEGLSLNPVHASDAARAVVAALALDGAHAINVAGKDIVTLRQVGEIIGTHLGKPPQFDIQPAPQSPSMVADISRMQALLGSPVTSFADGIADYCRHRSE